MTRLERFNLLWPLTLVGVGGWDAADHRPWLVFIQLAGAAFCAMAQAWTAASWHRQVSTWRGLYERLVERCGGAR